VVVEMALRVRRWVFASVCRCRKVVWAAVAEGRERREGRVRVERV